MKEATFSQKLVDKEYLDDPPQPRAEDPIPGLRESRLHRGVRYFPPSLPEGECDILFVQTSPLPEEASSIIVTPLGAEIPRKPGLGTGPAATITRESVSRYPDLHGDRVGFISLVPWLLPKNRRWRPNKEELAKASAWLASQVEKINPRVVVAMGKPAFDALSGIKIAHDDARYGWFATARGNIPLYLSFPFHQLITQPWQQDTLITDLKEVDRFLRTADRNPSGDAEITVISTLDELDRLVSMWEAKDLKLFSIDGEWGKGGHHLSADLRSFQFAWSNTEGAYLRFYNEAGERFLGAEVTFDEHGNEVVFTDYRKVGEILGRHLSKPGVQFIGHHLTADTPWMDRNFGIDVRGRCVFDSEYALQTIDEYAPRGLEAIALRFTGFGRYDMDLVMWKKAHPGATKDGYHLIPDEILIPYAVKDVLVVFQSMTPIMRRMEADGVASYYRSIVNPFVTDVFHDFVMCGLPVDMEIFNAVRTFMNWAYKVLMEDLLKALEKQADEIAAEKMGVPGITVPLLRKKVAGMAPDSAASVLTALNRDEAGIPLDEQPWFRHWLEVRDFNIRSHPVMRRWLFDTMGFTPVKTTGGGADGVPSMLWEKALELPEKIFKTVNPAVDKETLEILEQSDESGLISRLLAVNNVGNQCKGFLKEGDVDPATGEVVEENGLAKFIACDSRIHGQFSLTETGRPRSWSPNILNLSGYHNKGVEAGLTRVLDERPDLEIPEECAPVLGTREQIEREVDEFVNGPAGAKFFEEVPSRTAEDARRQVMKNIVKKRVPTVRSVVCAEPGWCFVESDYATAEIRALAFIFGDRTLIKFMTEPDPSWAFTKDGKKVRLYYDDASGIPAEAQNPEWIMKVVSEGKVVAMVSEDDLARDDAGAVVHPPYDLHWSLAELVYRKPREELKEKTDRGAAKVANFSCLDGETKILTDNGVKSLRLLKNTDLVWDGVGFVHHDGIVHHGPRRCVYHKGVVATPEHKILVDGEMIEIGDAGAHWVGEREVFDISDCGPRNRFAVLVPTSGLMVACRHERGERDPGDRGAATRGGSTDRCGGLSGGGTEAGPEDHQKAEVGGSGVSDGAEGEVRPGDQPAGGRRVDRLREVAAPGGEVQGPDLSGYRVFIVSNCAYGAVASTIERRIEAVTGEKPAEGTGEALLSALERRQPDVFRGLEEVAKAPQEGRVLVAASGRKRRFPVHSASLAGVSWRVRKGYLRAMGNEARNFYPQESVAATLARACRWLNSWYRSEGLKARAVIGLYDSVLTYCPEEERHVCAEAHEVFMHRINFWKYGRRYMNYPIDTDLVYRWSYKPSDEQKKALEDPSWRSLDEEISRGILGRLHDRERKIFEAQPWVLENLNKAEVSASTTN